MNEEGMSELIGSQEEGVFHRTDALAIDAHNIELAVEGCPVNIIHMGMS